MATSSPWVVNASPLILLGKLQRLDLLDCLAPAVWVPDGVIREVAMGEGSDPSTATSVTWALSRRHPDVPIPPTVAHWDLGAGESQVLSLCLETSAVAVLDDGAARACARVHELPLIGTLGVILRARRLGLIMAARPLIERMLAAGSFLDKTLLERELAKLDE